MARDLLTITAELVEPAGAASRYRVTATLTVTCTSLAEAVGAVAEAIGDLA